jgi:hypothetical protein
MTKMLNRATVVLKKEPDSVEKIEEVLEYVMAKYDLDVKKYTYEVLDELPEDLPTAVADQLSAQKRDGGPDSVYLVLWMD